MPIITKRSFLTGFASLLAAPAVVRAASIMPVKALPSVEDLLKLRMAEAYRVTAENMSRALYGDLVDVTRQAFVPRLWVQVWRADPLLTLRSE